MDIEGGGYIWYWPVGLIVQLAKADTLLSCALLARPTPRGRHPSSC